MLSGSLDDFTLPEVLRLLATLKKSGSLNVSRRAGSGRIDFRDGDVVYAENELSNSLLGQKLVQSGKITDVQLRQSLDVQATTGDRLGHILLVSQVVSKEDLETAVRAQIEDAAYELMCWEAGEFRWEKGEAESIEAELSLSVDDLIRAVTLRLEQRERVGQLLESPHAVPRLVARPPAGATTINVTPDQWRVMVLVDGATDVASISERSGDILEDTVDSLRQLVAAGLVEITQEADRLDDRPEQRGKAEQKSSGPGEETALPKRKHDRPSEVPEDWFEDPIEIVGPPPGLQGPPDEPDDPVVAFPTAPEPGSLAAPALPRVNRASAARELSGIFDAPRLKGSKEEDADADETVRHASGDPSHTPADKTPPTPPSRGIRSRIARRNSGS